MEQRYSYRVNTPGDPIDEAKEGTTDYATEYNALRLGSVVLPSMRRPSMTESATAVDKWKIPNGNMTVGPF